MKENAELYVPGKKPLNHTIIPASVVGYNVRLNLIKQWVLFELCKIYTNAYGVERQEPNMYSHWGLNLVATKVDGTDHNELIIAIRNISKVASPEIRQEWIEDLLNDFHKHIELHLVGLAIKHPTVTYDVRDSFLTVKVLRESNFIPQS